MNIFEQFANKSNENSTSNTVAGDKNTVTKTTDRDNDGVDTSINLVDDGQGNFMMHIPGEPAEVVEQNKAKAKVKEDSDKKKKKEKIEVKPLKGKEPTKTAYELIEEKLVKYPKIIVKVFSEKLYEYDNPDEIKMLKLEDITNNLIIDHDYEEFSNGVNWNISPNADKTIGYLIPTYKFQPKG